MRFAAAFLTLLLAGCALFPLSEAECRADPQARGYSDGFSGMNPQDLRLVPECRERHGIEVDRARYLAGWRSGPGWGVGNDTRSSRCGMRVFHPSRS